MGIQNLRRHFFPWIVRWGKRIEDKRFPRPPVIIGACPRSGTTLLQAVLSAHPRIFAIPRQTYAFEFWDPPRKDGPPRPRRLDRLYREFLFRRIPAPNHRWLEKTPSNVRTLPDILDYYQEHVRFIHLIRDGRDVVVSSHPVHSPGGYWVPPERWTRDVRAGLRFRGDPRVLTLFYEDMVFAFEETVSRLGRFLELDDPSPLLSWRETGTIHKSKHVGGELREVHGESVGRWKRPEHAERVAEFMSHAPAASLLRELGRYEEAAS